MQNIIEICKEFGLEIPTDKQAEFNKKVAENYLTKAEHEKKIGKTETDRDKWKTQAETAKETLKSFEGIDPEQIQTELATWKKKAEDAEENAKKQIYERDFADALKSEMEGYKFTSEAAKKSIMAEIKDAGLKLKDGKILGLSDLIEQIKKNDASAFVDEHQEQLEAGRARFTQPQKPGNRAKFGTMTRKEIMDIKDPSERQAAWAEAIKSDPDFLNK